MVAAGVCAVISNATAGPERRLRWTGLPPEPKLAAPSPRAAASPPRSATPEAARGPEIPAPDPQKPWSEISGGEAARLHAEGALFLDARRTAIYREGHVAGARPLSVWESDADEKVRALWSEGTDQKAPIVLYCSGGDCEDSHMLAQKLYLAGFDDLRVYRDGFPDWQKRGLPVTRGETP
jgi:rhodanese-related sulfurtransferase